MKSNTTPPKLNNLTVVDTKDSEEDESSDKELKIVIITMINEIKETSINS
jgi:hypothetical protein